MPEGKIVDSDFSSSSHFGLGSSAPSALIRGNTAKCDSHRQGEPRNTIFHAPAVALDAREYHARAILLAKADQPAALARLEGFEHPRGAGSNAHGLSKISHNSRRKRSDLHLQQIQRRDALFPTRKACEKNERMRPSAILFESAR